MTAQVQLRRLERRYYGLQYLRALAALMVLLVHALRPDDFPLKLLGSGVDLFFVLSGFLMVAITDETTRPFPFAIARLRRIVPLYWILTTGVVILLWGGMSWRSPIPFLYLANADHGVPLDLIAASYAFVPWYNPATQTIQPVIPAGWTLNLEMLFYAIVAVSLWLPRRWQLPMASLGILSLALAGVLHDFDQPQLEAWTSSITIEFLFGAWIGHAWQYRTNLWHRYLWLSLLTCGLLAVFYWLDPQETERMNFAAAIAFGALLIAVLQAEDRQSGISRYAIPLWLGDASYAIYLMQFAFIVIMQKNGIDHPAAYASILVLGTLTLEPLVHRFVDRYSRRTTTSYQSTACNRAKSG